jgi:hypothetical protein
MCCSIKALPSSFGCQSKLEVLVLLGTKIESIPSSIINLKRLRVLDIQFCSKLQAVPVLPSSLGTLIVECKSLKSVVFPSTVTEQFKENKKRIEFWNCLNLDERSVITHKYLLALEHDYIEYYTMSKAHPIRKRQV